MPPLRPLLAAVLLAAAPTFPAAAQGFSMGPSESLSQPLRHHPRRPHAPRARPRAPYAPTPAAPTSATPTPADPAAPPQTPLRP